MPFLMEPMGTGLKMNPDDHTMNTVEKHVPFYMKREHSKVVLTNEVVKSFPDGKWFEFEIAAIKGGFLQEIGIGLTHTTPDEIKALHAAQSFPPKAHKLPNSWVVGYQQSCYWNGKYESLDKSCSFDLALVGSKPEKETLGVLLDASEGDIVIFKDRREIWRVKPSEFSLDPISTAKDLYGVVDLVGGIERIRLKSSVPPSKEEQQALAEAAKKAAEAVGPSKEKGSAPGAEAPPAAAEGDAPTGAAEGDAEAPAS